VACIGECMIELAVPDAGDTARVDFAGDTYNTAVYLHREAGPGVGVAYVTALGRDTLSERMVARFAAEGLDTDLVERRADRGPGLYAIATDAAGERSFTYWRERSATRTLFLAPGRELVHDVTVPTVTRVQGIARDRRGRALPRMDIVAEGAPGECLPWCHEMTTTSDTGEFTLSITRPALYHVHVEGEPGSVAVSLPPERLEAERLDLTLPGVVVSGRVESAPGPTGELEGVILRRSESSGEDHYQSSRVSPLAADGSFAFHAVSPGRISLETHFLLAEVPTPVTFTVGEEDIVGVSLPAPNLPPRPTPGLAEDWSRIPPLVPDAELDAELQAELEAFNARQSLEESLETDASKEVAETRDVRIRLVAEEDGGPVAHGQVLPPLDLHAEPADPWGTFDIAGAPLDEFEIWCGGSWRDEREAIVPAMVTEVTVEMQPLARLDVLLVDEEAHPLADWMVVPASERDAADRQEADADLELMAEQLGVDPLELTGRRWVTSSRGTRMLGLPLGENEIVLTSPDGGRTERVTLDVGVAGPHDVVLRMGPDGATLARHDAPIRVHPGSR